MVDLSKWLQLDDHLPYRTENDSLNFQFYFHFSTLIPDKLLNIREKENKNNNNNNRGGSDLPIWFAMQNDRIDGDDC